MLILINTITLAMKIPNPSEVYTMILDESNMAFTAIFAMEFIFKLAAFRVKVSSDIFDYLQLKRELR